MQSTMCAQLMLIYTNIVQKAMTVYNLHRHIHVAIAHSSASSSSAHIINSSHTHKRLARAPENIECVSAFALCICGNIESSKRANRNVFINNAKFQRAHSSIQQRHLILFNVWAGSKSSQSMCMRRQRRWIKCVAGKIGMHAFVCASVCMTAYLSNSEDVL